MKCYQNFVCDICLKHKGNKSNHSECSKKRKLLNQKKEYKKPPPKNLNDKQINKMLSNWRFK